MLPTPSVPQLNFSFLPDNKSCQSFYSATLFLPWHKNTKPNYIASMYCRLPPRILSLHAIQLNKINWQICLMLHMFIANCTHVTYRYISQFVITDLNAYTHQITRITWMSLAIAALTHHSIDSTDTGSFAFLIQHSDKWGKLGFINRVTFHLWGYC